MNNLKILKVITAPTKARVRICTVTRGYSDGTMEVLLNDGSRLRIPGALEVGVKVLLEGAQVTQITPCACTVFVD